MCDQDTTTWDCGENPLRGVCSHGNGPLNGGVRSDTLGAVSTEKEQGYPSRVMQVIAPTSFQH